MKKAAHPVKALKDVDQRFWKSLKADRVADAVMRMAVGRIQMQPIEEEEMQMQPQEEEKLRMTSLSQSIIPIIQKQTDTTTTGENDQTQTQNLLCGRTLPQSEVAERTQILSDFTRGLSAINDSFRRVIVSSMCDFSLHQLRLMKDAGLRFWIGSSVPPIFADNVQRDTQRGDASYARAIRTIFLGDTVNPGYLTHEMAHAWDHIRNMPSRRRVRLDDLNPSLRLRLIRNPGQYLSETNRRQNIRSGERVTRMTFGQMHSAYTNRVPRRELAFGVASRLGYSQSDPTEFYAEGYAVFHGSSIMQQAKLYRYARELYIFLHSEAIDEGMSVPDLTATRTEAERLPPPR